MPSVLNGKLWNSFPAMAVAFSISLVVPMQWKKWKVLGKGLTLRKYTFTFHIICYPEKSLNCSLELLNYFRKYNTEMAVEEGYRYLQRLWDGMGYTVGTGVATAQKKEEIGNK